MVDAARVDREILQSQFIYVGHVDYYSPEELKKEVHQNPSYRTYRTNRWERGSQVVYIEQTLNNGVIISSNSSTANNEIYAEWMWERTQEQQTRWQQLPQEIQDKLRENWLNDNLMFRVRGLGPNDFGTFFEQEQLRGFYTKFRPSR